MYGHQPDHFLKRSLNLIYEENFVSGIDKSIIALANHLGNKVDREAKLNTIKYDTIVEEKPRRSHSFRAKCKCI